MTRYTVKRVDAKRSPYVEYALRCQYAHETFIAIQQPVDVQIMQLELMYGTGAL